MLISHKHKFITIDIPKTGSRSLRESLCPLNVIDIYGEPQVKAKFYQHGTGVNCRFSLSQYNIDYNEYYTFCIVRNPWDRYYSYLKYFKMYANLYKNLDSKINWRAPEINQGKNCVDMFTNRTDLQVLEMIIHKYPPQSYYYMDGSNVIVEQIAEFSNINQEFKKLCNRVGLPDDTPLVHKNKTNSENNNIYTQELIDLVGNKESFTINLMKYDYIK